MRTNLIALFLENLSTIRLGEFQYGPNSPEVIKARFSPALILPAATEQVSEDSPYGGIVAVRTSRSRSDSPARLFAPFIPPRLMNAPSRPSRGKLLFCRRPPSAVVTSIDVSVWKTPRVLTIPFSNFIEPSLPFSTSEGAISSSQSDNTSQWIATIVNEKGR